MKAEPGSEPDTVKTPIQLDYIVSGRIEITEADLKALGRGEKLTADYFTLAVIHD